MRAKFLGWAIAAGSLLAASCSREAEPTSAKTGNDGEEVTVTFMLAAEDGAVRTRSGESDWTISDGTQIDRVVYAVYKPQYETGEDGVKSLKGYALQEQYGVAEEGLGKGQALLKSTENLLNIVKDSNGNITGGGETLTLRLVRGQEYTIGFWAQNSKCSAYDSGDLEKVVVDYTADDGLNNDENRDAYYQSITFTAQADARELVILKRALAQVNVGTAGWDYNEEVDYGHNYYYSKVEMTGLYDTVDILTGALGRTNLKQDDKVTFAWNRLPAYLHTEGYEGLVKGEPEGAPVKVDPQEEGYEAYKKAYEAYMQAHGEDYDKWREACREWLLKKDGQKKEEYLSVKLVDTSTEYLPYLEEKPATEASQITTEVFKYLSMCYVLAPSLESDTTDDAAVGGKGGTTVSSLSFYLAEVLGADGNAYVYDPYPGNPEMDTKALVGDDSDKDARFTLDNVPIQRNWRTNILGGTRGANTTLFDPRSISFTVHLSPAYDGEHNYNDNTQGTAGENNEWTQDGGYQDPNTSHPKE